MLRKIRPALIVGAAAVIAAIAVTAEASPAGVGARRGQCSGVTSLRTLAVRPRRRVDLHARRTTIGTLTDIRRPKRIVHGRSGFERTTYEVVAQITLARRTANNTIQLVLFDKDAYMSAVLPPLQCLSARTPGRALIAAARYRFGGGCGTPGTEWQESGAVAYITGVGFWGPTRGRRGAAANGASLAPVTGIRFLAGCGARR